MENAEFSRGRAPGDIDVVTFYYVPEGHTRESLARAFPGAFDKIAAKRNFSVDSYFVGLNQTDAKIVVNHTAYWYSVWSHTKDRLRWKGFVEVDLDPREDESARAALDRMSGEDGGLQ